MWREIGGGETYTAFLWVNLQERGNLENLDVSGNTILQEILKKEDGKVWARLIGARLRTSSWLLLTR
jgi:hypothetical protein